MKIIFQKPKLKKGYICVDMHTHTDHTDGIASADEILKKIRKKNIGVAITDHTGISGCIEVFKKKKKSDFIIPGIEVMSKNGFDALFYFYDLKTLKKFFEKEIKNNRVKIREYRGNIFYKTNLSLKKILKLEKKYKCVVSLAHPFGYSLRAKPLDIRKHKHLFKYAHAIEVINGGNEHLLNKKAVELHSETKLGITGGSDSHSIFTFGDVMTYSKAKNITEFLDNIKKKENFVIGKELPFGRKMFYFYYLINKIIKVFKK